MGQARTAEEWAEYLASKKEAARKMRGQFAEAERQGLTVAEGVEAGIIPEANEATKAFVRKYGRYGDGR